MSSAVLTALLVLQVFRVYGTSLVLNGTVGESIVLPTDEEGPIRGPGFMEWLKNKVTVIRLVNKQGSSSFETRETNTTFEGRLMVNYETGALNISSLREEDSGEYLFKGIGASGSLRPKTIQLHIYERIVSVQVTSQVNNSTNGTSCNATLSCSVIGGSQVVLSWSRNGKNFAVLLLAENRTTLTVSLTHAEEDYTCTAINPISSLSNTTRPCPTEITRFPYIYIAAGGGGLLVVMMVITLMCILKKSKRGEAHEDTTVYAEVGDNMHTQKGSVNSQPPQSADVNTFYDVIKGTGTPAAPSTVYDMVKFERATPTQYQEVL